MQHAYASDGLWWATPWGVGRGGRALAMFKRSVVGTERDEDEMHHMPSGDHSATQLSRASEVYRDKCGFLLKRSGGKHSSISPKGMTKAFSFGQLTCAPALRIDSDRLRRAARGMEARSGTHWCLRMQQALGRAVLSNHRDGSRGALGSLRRAHPVLSCSTQAAPAAAT